MTQITHLADASSPPIACSVSSETIVRAPDPFVKTQTTTQPTQPAVIVHLDDHRPQIDIPADCTTVEAMVEEWERDEKRRALLEQARQWGAETLYRTEGDTVRTLRLRKGWSQVQLASELKTSQSHIARIESGTENVAISTCRRLSVALGVDMNTLDEALRRQEAVGAKA